MSEAALPSGLVTNPSLDRWIEFTTDERVTIRTGKAELGQGLRTALTAIAADELSVNPARIAVECAATGSSPAEGNTGGSRSMEQSGAAVRQACAHARRILLTRGCEQLGCSPKDASVTDGVIGSPSGRTVSYWALHGGRRFDFDVDQLVDIVPVAARRYVGHGLPRVDLSAKVRGEPVFVHDMVISGMRYARVVRAQRRGAQLLSVAQSPDDVSVVRRGNFLAVVADRAARAIEVAAALATSAQWEGGDTVPGGADAADYLEAHVKNSTLIVDGTAVPDPVGDRLTHTNAASVVTARYSRPFVMHGSIGPSAAVAHYSAGRLELWSHSQNVEALRLSVAEVLGLAAEYVVARHVDGAGCYGHNGADDVALDAALVAHAVPDTPISLTWSRADEHGWEPLGSAMSIRLEAGLDATGQITSWQHEQYSYSHGTRPQPTTDDSVPSKSGLLAAWDLEPSLARPIPKHGRGSHSGAHRNADPIYSVGTKRVVSHLVEGMNPRTSSLRALGAYANGFAIESFMDELAIAAGSDPVSFRLRHLSDPRARAVIETAVQMAGGLTAPGEVDAPGRGLGFARYKNSKSSVAVVAELVVAPRSGEIRLTHAWIAADAGQVVDPDGLINQLEGGFVQAASWTLKERVVFDANGVRSLDWDSYPILKFSEVPEIQTMLLDHPGESPLGAGEAVAGPAAGAIANAFAQATTVRMRDLPLLPEQVKRALNAAW